VLNTGWWPMLWFIGKLWLFMFAFIWLRGTLPRLRYDQFMKFGWKVLIPISLIWIVLVGIVRAIGLENGIDRNKVLVIGGIALVLVMIGTFLYDAVANRGTPESEEPTFDPFAGGYPVPPLPGENDGESDTASAEVTQSAEVRSG
jgi:NADH-quinone oxidoreductase subunit H